MNCWDVIDALVETGAAESVWEAANMPITIALLILDARGRRMKRAMAQARADAPAAASPGQQWRNNPDGSKTLKISGMDALGSLLSGGLK